MHGPNSHVVFSPKKSFQEFQLHQTYLSLDFGTCQDHSILDKSISAIFNKIFSFNFVLVFFQKYDMTSVHKNPKISVNIYYFTNRRHNFLRY